MFGDDNLDWCNTTTTNNTCISHGIGGVGNKGSTPCHRAGQWALCNICDLPTSPDEGKFWDRLLDRDPTGKLYDPSPNGLSKAFIVFNHILPFVTTIMVMCAVFYKLDVLNERIGKLGGCLINLGICFLAISSMCEFVNHALLMDWNMCYDSSDNPTYLLFYIFNCGGNSLVALGLRKKGTPWLRPVWKHKELKDVLSDSLSMVSDLGLIFFNLTILPSWYNPGGYLNFYTQHFKGNEHNHFQGRPVAAAIFIPVACFSALMQMVRIYTNLGPTDQHKRYAGLAFATAFSPIMGVVIDVLMTKSPNQWWHGLLALAFGLNEVFLFVCVLYAVPLVRGRPCCGTTNGGERTPLIKYDL